MKKFQTAPRLFEITIEKNSDGNFDVDIMILSPEGMPMAGSGGEQTRQQLEELRNSITKSLEEH